jgi:hypothetical protein
MKTLDLETINDVDYLTVDGEIAPIFFDKKEAAQLRAKTPSLWLAHLLKTLEGERLEDLFHGFALILTPGNFHVIRRFTMNQGQKPERVRWSEISVERFDPV